MRGVFSLIGLVVVLALVGVLAKKQLAPKPLVMPVGAASAPASGTVRQQSQQIQQDVKKAIEGAMQQPRPLSEDSP
ncbi:hypothetical protein RD110_13860 [Rhodoferax koreense]|uniref:Uncharacterized protein n=1 Tax=Rhodoferax koreensis TaxID=1842727 RepID=A0A1P8JWP9_9BURK|nr:hypothetical protein [Rhodoferax koreense]APW38148.1 hypothetical protein RD110_13860 [Rhodoferax koreense]